MKKIAFIPIDNRPVCYSLIKDIAKIDFGIELVIPQREFLGDLKKIADVDKIKQWLSDVKNLDAVVLSLDTIAHGGLVPSRRSGDSFEQIKSRLDEFKSILKEKKCKVYAFSSIMRISNNNINEEEKEYWNLYGKKIFDYSYTLHKEGDVPNVNIPLDILEDYANTRKRNFDINKIYLDWMDEGILNTLVFSKDDCAKYGLNVMEAEKLQKLITEKQLPALIKTGADEIPLTLFAKAISDMHETKPKVFVQFTEPEYKNLISNYEDISIEKSVNAQLTLAGCEIVEDEDADIVLLVNNFINRQGEIVMGVETQSFSRELTLPQKPYMIADVRFANGADNQFVKKLFEQEIDFEKFYGYSAWNTSANSLGSLICAAVVKFYAKSYAPRAFKKLQATRFLDDWAYQGNVRQSMKEISSAPDTMRVKQLMFPYEKRICKKLNVDLQLDYKFPWDRLFEVEVILK